MSDQSDSEDKGSIKIIDRRRFDDQGTEKGTVENPIPNQARQAASVTEKSSSGAFIKDEPPKVLEEKPHEQAAVNHSHSDPESSEEDQLSFGSFVLSLATQALMLMGQLKPPDGIPLSVDPAAAKQTIDILSMLEHKTKGNLTTQENNLLKDALHNLRVAFLNIK